MLTAKAKGRSSEPAPAGIQKARCIGVVDIGTQHSELYGKDVHKVRITFELPECLHVFKPENGPEPFVISRWFTVSLHKQSAMRPFLESWRGRAFTAEELEGFNLSKLVGVPATLVIIHETNDEGEIRAIINTAAPGDKLTPKQILPSCLYEVEMGQNEIYQSLPEKVRSEITKCKEWTKESMPSNDELGVKYHDEEAMDVSF